MRSRAVALGLFLLAIGGSRAGAQTVPDSLDRHAGWLIGASFGVPGYGSEPAPELFTIGFHWTQVQPGALGADLSIGTMPRVLAEGFAVVGVRAGVALPLAVGRSVLLMPSGGASLIGGAGGGGGAALGGLNAGIAAVLFGTSSVGLRTGVTWHRFEGANGAIWLLELGFVGDTRRRR
jgi:hypothetical protein